MELVIKILSVAIVLAVLYVLLWSYMVRTQADVDTQAAASEPSPIYYSNPVTKVYIADASGNSWKRFYSS